jgi:hypothetical protein
MVLLDSSSPEQMTKVSSYATQFAFMRRGQALLPTLARVGLGPLFAGGAGLPADDADRVDAMTSTTRAQRNGRDEISMLPRTLEQSQALTTLDDRPLVVLSSSEQLKVGGWRAAQDKLAALSSDSVQRDVDSSHAGMVSDHDPATTESARAITEVVEAIRTQSTVD